MSDIDADQPKPKPKRLPKRQVRDIYLQDLPTEATIGDLHAHLLDEYGTSPGLQAIEGWMADGSWDRAKYLRAVTPARQLQRHVDTRTLERAEGEIDDRSSTALINIGRELVEIIRVMISGGGTIEHEGRAPIKIRPLKIGNGTMDIMRLAQSVKTIMQLGHEIAQLERRVEDGRAGGLENAPDEILLGEVYRVMRAKDAGLPKVPELERYLEEMLDAG